MNDGLDSAENEKPTTPEEPKATGLNDRGTSAAPPSGREPVLPLPDRQREGNLEATALHHESQRPFTIHVEIYETTDTEPLAFRELDDEAMLVISLPFNPNQHRVDPSDKRTGVRDLEEAVSRQKEMVAKVMLWETMAVLPSIDTVDMMPEQNTRDAAVDAVMRYADTPVTTLVQEYLEDM